MVGGQHHRAALLAVGRQVRFELRYALLVQGSERLVENPQRRAGQVQPGQGHAALLAVLLSLDGLFRSDFEDGSLEQWVLSPHPLALLVLAKVLAHWIFSGLALVLLAPLLALMLGLPSHCLPVLLGSLLLGTPVLSLLGAVGAALTVGLKRGGLLLALLILPLYIPVLILGSGALQAALQNMPATGHLLWLASLTALAVTLAPFAIAAGLKISVGE